MLRGRGASPSERLARVTVVLVLVYLALVVHQEHRDHGEEAFPFFNWSLFSEVPGPRVTDYGIRIVEANGNVLDEPRYFEDAAWLVTDPSSPDAQRLAHLAGLALDNDRADRAADDLAVFEARFLGNLDQVRYEVVARTYDVLERYECRCYRDERVLGEFEVVP